MIIFLNKKTNKQTKHLFKYLKTIYLLNLKNNNIYYIINDLDMSSDLLLLFFFVLLLYTHSLSCMSSKFNNLIT